ncbi:Mite group 2 allergen Lep d 2 [Halotydeus destructor]|nr:Mite group 2 allergen Lep d 2 [Halotydeus destructor]
MSKVVDSLLIVLLITTVSVNSLKLKFSDCGKKEVKEIRSSTCEEDPCRVPIGGHVIVEVDFLPRKSAEKVDISVFASVFGFEVALPLDDTDACSQGRLKCPVKAGQRQTLKYELKIKDTYYPVSGDVGFRLTNSDDEEVACASISAELFTPEEHQEL